MNHFAFFFDCHSGRFLSRIGMVLLAALVAFTSGLGAQPTAPSTIDLARVPLVVNAGVAPNILVTLDDSGSMGWGFMPDGANYAVGNRRRYDAAFNRIYYNPTVTYSPPLRPNGSSFPDATFSSAPWDGFRPALGSSNLGTRYRVSGDHQGGCSDYSCGWLDTGFPSGVVSGSNIRAFYFTGTTLHIVGPSERQNFANWFSYYRTRSLAARSALSTAFARIDPKTRMAWQNFNVNHLNPGTTQINAIEEGGTWRTSFFNWLHEPRQTGNTPMLRAFYRAGRFFEEPSGNTAANPYYDADYGDELSCRQNFHVMMTDGYGNVAVGANSVTPPNYDTANQAIGPSGDGKTLSGPASRVYHSVSAGGTAAPNLSDMAMYFWARDLRPSLENNVPAYFGDYATGLISGATPDDEIYFNPANDPATWQRMVNFNVTFGAGGTLAYNPATLQAIRTGSADWPAVTSGTATTIDDAWHAAVNSRGEFLSAEDPQQLNDALASILDNVSRRQGSSGGSGSSVFLRSNEYEYTARYDSGDWTGDVVAAPNGATPWPATAADQITSRGSARTIYTWVPTGTGASAGNRQPFQWSSLSATQQSALRFNPNNGTTDSVSVGQARLEYLRGDQALEQANGGTFRNRNRLMGAIIGSNLAYVERPAQGYSGRVNFAEGGQEYADFVLANALRTPMLYVGANDGMLHAINGATGREEWAFVPNKVIANLPRLTTPAFQFVPTVDGKLSISDVYIDGQWRTVLVGTLGLGGQAVYAIDVTVPNNPRVLWEFNDSHDAELGFNYGAASIARIRYSGGYRWVALVPSGYNNELIVDGSTRDLPHARPDVHAAAGNVLFVLDVENGAQLGKFVLPSCSSPEDDDDCPWGLAEVTVGEYGNNYVADFAVGGDLNGNLWRFDLEDISTGDVKHVFDGSPDRPITSAPRIFHNASSPHGSIVFVFGSGKYLELSDSEVQGSDPRQALYGIYECRTCPAVVESDLVDQEFVEGNAGFIGLDETRIMSMGDRGWRALLGNQTLFDGALTGERIVDTPSAVLSAGVVIFSSSIPSDDPCSPGRGRVDYVLSAFSGGYVLPGSVNSDGDAAEPGDPIFPYGDADGGDVGALVDVEGELPPEGYENSSGSENVAQLRISPDGCLSLGETKTNICITPRRRGWRELSVE